MSNSLFWKKQKHQLETEKSSVFHQGQPTRHQSEMREITETLKGGSENESLGGCAILPTTSLYSGKKK